MRKHNPNVIRKCVTHRTVVCKAYNKQTKEIETITVDIPYRTRSSELTVIFDKANITTHIPVDLIKFESTDTIYEMPLDKFLENATEVKSPLA